MSAVEANFDGLIGPTHNYGGLSYGNLASAGNAGLISRPRDAAIQGLDKMKAMADSGLVQGLLPPHARPDVFALRRLGYTGDDQTILTQAWSFDQALVRNVSSASCMWAANAATVSPSADCADGRLHVTPANLSTMLHRSIEHKQIKKALKAAFPLDGVVQVHNALPMQSVFSDEGAANHVRLCAEHGTQGVEIFVYGRDAFSDDIMTKFPARQTVQAGQAIMRLHELDTGRTVFACQSRRAIEAGAFHNDVVCVGALSTLFYHEYAFADKDLLKANIDMAARGLFEPHYVEVKNTDVPIEDAIKAYLFNSMLVQMPGDVRLTLIAPTETKNNPRTKAYCDKLIAGNGPIGNVIYVDVRQSMCNGGGPACLRLRIVLNERELASTNPAMIINDDLHMILRDWVMRHYRETLAPEDIGDPSLMRESFHALDELTRILDLGADFYPFQREAY